MFVGYPTSVTGLVHIFVLRLGFRCSWTGLSVGWWRFGLDVLRSGQGIVGQVFGFDWVLVPGFPGSVLVIDYDGIN